jgi:regulator of protease activity HflC (stomatin/prohibitin superfamily)
MSEFMRRRQAQLAAEEQAEQEYRSSDEYLFQILGDLDAEATEILAEAEQKQKQHDKLSRILASNMGFSEHETERFVRACRHPLKEWSPEAQRMLKAHG